MDWRRRALTAAPLLLLLALWLGGVALTHGGLLGHTTYDQYTLQALAWRDGRVDVPSKTPWLELAHFQGRQFANVLTQRLLIEVGQLRRDDAEGPTIGNHVVHYQNGEVFIPS